MRGALPTRTHRVLAVAIALAATAACDPPGGSPDLAPADLGAAPSLRVDAVQPLVVGRGDRVLVEGEGLDGARLRWGDRAVAYEWQGAARLLFRVPEDAVGGRFTVERGDARVDVDVTLLATGVAPQPFGTWAPQTVTALVGTRLDGGNEAALVRVGARAIALGGRDERGRPVDTVRSAAISADGSVGAFETLPVRLLTARAGHSAHVVGDAILVVGGSSLDAPLDTIERLEVAADGTLGAPVIAGTLRVARAGHAAAIVGGALVVAGGSNGAPLASVERLLLGPGAAVGASDGVSRTLVRPRVGASLVVGERGLWVIGGVDGGALVADVEELALERDGTIGAPAARAIRLAVPRAFASLTAAGSRWVWAGGVVAADGNVLAPSATATVLAVDDAGPSAVATLPAGPARAAHGAIVASGTLSLVGGRDRLDSTGARSPEVARAALLSGAGRLVAAGPLRDPAHRRFATRWLVGDRLLSCGGLGTATGDGGGAGLLFGDCSARELAGDVDGAAGALTASRTGAVALDTGRAIVALFGLREPWSNAIERTPRAVPPTFVAESVATMLADPPLNACAVVVAGELVVVAGKVLQQPERNGIRDDVLAAPLGSDGAPGPFRTIGHLATPRYAHACAVVGESLVVAGGTTCATTATPCPEVEVASTEIARVGEWIFRPGPTLDGARSGLALALVGSTLVALGGGATPASRSTIATDGSLGSWEPLDAPIPPSWAGGAAVAIGERIVLVDGEAEGPLPTALALVPTEAR